ncbi:MAG: hypothetical protein HC897_09920 [Thermoanaerobaculia bacterium]|nr:hypothetical protein [Thermoanaerobaculia bacterium]
MGPSRASAPPPTSLPVGPPRGLVFFRPGTPNAFRRRRWIATVFFLIAGSLVIWPVYPFFAGASPQILGLPLSLAWIVIALLTVFVTLLWLFRHEER